MTAATSSDSWTTSRGRPSSNVGGIPELVRDGETFSIRDLGSLNGTYVNRKRIESVILEDDDEVQIGKYRLTFLQR